MNLLRFLPPQLRRIGNIKKYIIPIIALILLCALVLALVLYQMGYYDISFIERPARQAAGEYQAGPDYIEEGNFDDPFLMPTIESENLSGVFDPQQIDGVSSPAKAAYTPTPTPPQSAVTQKLPTVTELKAVGYVHSITPYNKETHKIGVVVNSIPLPEKMVMRDGRTALQPYMGYILCDNGTSISALGINGVVSVAGIDKLTPAYQRDIAGHPLFLYKNRYYYLVDNSNQMVEVQHDTLFSPPLIYDSPYAFRKNTSGLYRYYEKFVTEGEPDKILWGYADAGGNSVIPAQYSFATEFDETGYAVVADENKVISVITKDGSVKINPHGNTIYMADRDNRPAIDGYYLPETFGLECIGMFYFDHGLMRVRQCVYDYFKEEQMVRERDLLIHTDGRIYKIPADYTLIGYSDGVLLLEKNGVYGYMDYTGRWVAQPIYSYAQPFLEGLAVVGFTTGKKGVIDTEGNIVIPFNYEYVSNVSYGVIVAFSRREGWVIFNKMMR